MSRGAKISFLVGFLVLVAMFAVQVMAGGWINLNYVLLFGALIAGLAGIAFDYKMYVEFLTMRTTKHGMNMGAMILTVLVLLVCVNYLANSHNKSWDVTQEKLNSLSDQSTSLLKSLKNDIDVKVFTRGAQVAEEKQRVKQSLQMYQDYSNHIKVRFVNPYVDGDLAMQYLNDLPDRETAATVVFVENGGKKVRVEQPFDEAAITGALIKSTRQAEAKIYFLKGHGEKDVNGEGDQSLRELARALGESSFKVDSLSLIDTKEIPKDAAVLAIVGPSLPYLDSELQRLREFLQNGGHIFLALDPGQRHNLANLTKSLGVQFQNNYVITMAPVTGGGPAMILGTGFDTSSEITKSFPPGQSFSLFYLASEVTPAADKPAGIQAKELVRSDEHVFTVNEIKGPIKPKQTKPVSLAVTSHGTLSDAKDAKAFSAVVFGDSDFLSNRSLLVGINKDLALNSFADLAEQKDLISIRPKVPKGSMLFLTSFARLVMVVFTLVIPVFLLMTSGVVWFRRRGA